MAEIIWTEPALDELNEVADYIALENPPAASELVHRVLQHVEQLADHPESGARLHELRNSRYRQIVEPPCRIFYRLVAETFIILYVMRSERSLRKSRLTTKR